MYTLALAECRSDVVPVTVCVPATPGGEYRPALLIVPEAADPPVTPSTDQVMPPALAVNCCGCVDVRAVVLGLIENPLTVIAVTSLAMSFAVLTSPPPPTAATLVTLAGALAATVTVSVIAG